MVTPLCLPQFTYVCCGATETHRHRHTCRSQKRADGTELHGVGPHQTRRQCQRCEDGWLYASHKSSASKYFNHTRASVSLLMRLQQGWTVVVSQLLRAGADVTTEANYYGTARQAAFLCGNHGVVSLIDEHLRRQLRTQLVELCVALQAANWPVLVLLECFAWTSAASYAAQHVKLPLDLQWRIAKRVRS